MRGLRDMVFAVIDSRRYRYKRFFTASAFLFIISVGGIKIRKWFFCTLCIFQWQVLID